MASRFTTLLAASLGLALCQKGKGTFYFILSNGTSHTPIAFGGVLNNAVVQFAMNQYNTTIVDSQILPLSYNSTLSGSAV